MTLAFLLAAVSGCGKNTSPESCTIEAAGYDQSCTTDADCVGVPSGDLCTATCTNCTGAAINVTAQSQYQAALSKLTYAAKECPCPNTQVFCNQQVCSLTAPNDAGP